MDFDELHERACINLRLLLPQVQDPTRLVDECLLSARKSFRDDFILSLSPEAWARISLVYISTFLDSGVDVPVGDIVAAVVSDSIHLRRIDLLAQQVGQRRAEDKTTRPSNGANSACLKVVKS
ncbi:MAG TPA: hypothetical protein PLN96_02755 [Zoogloea sp.]|uniref:hypothetical protein n=1 Tax=Zoogloea sp. TaxID=49181 RepID=UPI002C3929F0|nr:hypothetical protein [Zoogloea sp.]HMW52101.1 hypothetical protein [Rhodocyclaceae bacterium]HMY48501.1 hypothetical protein [Rhodocyclaceae bacterium]HMZ77594.1 hypothetical protein [Rhodocyclaceae bacterium]HNC80152.1 hypothetical protein [Rhodocyclaceae bacterium]HND25626.1 hypothetical protein [Rhodocyclaceae bacterium]